jgi:hypothetical protein
LGDTNEHLLSSYAVVAGTEEVVLSAPSGNNAAGITVGPTGVVAPGGDAYHLMPGKDLTIRARQVRSLAVRGAATDKLYILAGNMS